MSISTTHRQLILPVYLPSILLAIGTQAAGILIPLYVLKLGGTEATTSLVLLLRGLGMLLIDIPAGMLTHRYGEKKVMILGASGLTLSFCVMALITNLIWISILALASGSFVALWLLGRLAFISDASTGNERGRIVSVMAATQRFGVLIGPLLGGLIAKYYGLESALFVTAAMILAAGVTVQFTVTDDHVKPDGKSFSLKRVIGIIRDNGYTFATAGFGAFCLMVMRALRPLLVVLVGHKLGLDAAQIGVVMTASAVLDIGMSYPAGIVMDRLGRKYTAIPGSILMACGYGLLPFADSYATLIWIFMLVGFGNGIATGVLIAMGADLSPKENRGEFLGVWRLLSDAGFVAGPAAVGLLVGIGSLNIAFVGTAALGFLGATVLWKLVPETLVKKHSEVQNASDDQSSAGSQT